MEKMKGGKNIFENNLAVGKIDASHQWASIIYVCLQVLAGFFSGYLVKTLLQA